MIVNITIFIFINRSNNRYYFRQWGDVHSSKHRVTNSHYLFETGSFFYICCTHTCTHIYAYSEAARGVIPCTRKKIGGSEKRTSVCRLAQWSSPGQKLRTFFMYIWREYRSRASRSSWRFWREPVGDELLSKQYFYHALARPLIAANAPSKNEKPCP